MHDHSSHLTSDQTNKHSHEQTGHGHYHPVTEESSAIAWAFFLNLTFTIIEFLGGMFTNSTAIMADAVHDLGDSLAIGLAWFLSRLGKKPSDGQFSYGYRRFSLLGSVINGVILLVGSVWVLSQSIPRLMNPEMPVVEGMFGLAILGVAVNGYAAFKLSRGKSMAERMLNWHMLEDVLGWVAVLIISIVLYFVEWPILDPILSILFTCFILYNVVKNLNQTIRLFLQATPNKEQYMEIQGSLLALPFVEEIHHLHIWSLDGARNVLTAHLVVTKSINLAEQRDLKEKICLSLDKYDFEHTTIELEFFDEQCRDST